MKVVVIGGKRRWVEDEEEHKCSPALGYAKPAKTFPTWLEAAGTDD